MNSTFHFAFPPGQLMSIGLKKTCCFYNTVFPWELVPGEVIISCSVEDSSSEEEEEEEASMEDSVTSIVPGSSGLQIIISPEDQAQALKSEHLP